jgi:hypothetical protein
VSNQANQGFFAVREGHMVLGYRGSVEYLPLISGYSTSSLIQRILALTSGAQ